MTLSRIVMRLARNPGTEFAGGDDHRGYALTAPLTADGMIDEAAYGKSKAQCVVRRFTLVDTSAPKLLIQSAKSDLRPSAHCQSAVL